MDRREVPKPAMVTLGHLFLIQMGINDQSHLDATDPRLSRNHPLQTLGLMIVIHQGDNLAELAIWDNKGCLLLL